MEKTHTTNATNTSPDGVYDFEIPEGNRDVGMKYVGLNRDKADNLELSFMDSECAVISKFPLPEGAIVKICVH